MKQVYAQITNPVLGKYGGTTNEDGGSILSEILANLYKTIVMVGGLALLLYLVMGGLEWLNSGGDPEKLKNAQDRITNAVIGMTVLVLTVAIADFLGKVLGINILRLEIPGV